MSHERFSDSPSDEPIAATLLRGVVAGAVGTLALDAVTSAMWNLEDQSLREQEFRARPKGLDPAHAIPDRVAGLFGAEWTRQPNPAGIATHFAIGIVPAALYAVARRRIPQLRVGGGALLGLGLFLVQDEFVNSALGLAGRPSEYPRAAHVRGLAGHIAYGIATEAALEFLDPQS